MLAPPRSRGAPLDHRTSTAPCTPLLPRSSPISILYGGHPAPTTEERQAYTRCSFHGQPSVGNTPQSGRGEGVRAMLHCLMPPSGRRRTTQEGRGEIQASTPPPLPRWYTSRSRGTPAPSHPTPPRRCGAGRWQPRIRTCRGGYGGNCVPSTRRVPAKTRSPRVHETNRPASANTTTQFVQNSIYRLESATRDRRRREEATRDGVLKNLNLTRGPTTTSLASSKKMDEFLDPEEFWRLLGQFLQSELAEQHAGENRHSKALHR